MWNQPNLHALSFTAESCIFTEGDQTVTAIVFSNNLWSFDWLSLFSSFVDLKVKAFRERGSKENDVCSETQTKWE